MGRFHVTKTKVTKVRITGQREDVWRGQTQYRIRGYRKVSSEQILTSIGIGSGRYIVIMEKEL